MIITCENCSTSFNLDEKFLKPSGSKVRCSKCKHIFTAFPATVTEEKQMPSEESPAGEPAPAAGLSTGPEKDVASDAALAGEASEDLGLERELEAEPETGWDAAAEDPDLSTPDEEKTGTAEIDAFGADEAAEDLGLDIEPGAEPEAGQEEELDLSSLDDVFDTEAGQDGDAVGDAEEELGDDLLEDLGLDLDMDAEPEPGEAIAAGEPEEATDVDELDLSGLDEALDMEGEPAEEVVAAVGDTAGEDLLEDLDLEMDTEPQDEDSAAADELDMSDIRFELGDEAEADAEADADDEDADLELGLEMDSDFGEIEADKQELDMVGFEETLGMESPPETKADTGDDADELDLELDLEMEGDGQPETEPGVVDKPAGELEEEIEDLDFELDMEFDPDEDLEGAELELESEDADDLDMTDIEQMLEIRDNDLAGGEVGESALDEETEVEKWKDTPGEKGVEDEAAEIDLSDLDFDTVSVEDVEIEDRELDLDLDEETIKSAEAIVAGRQASSEQPQTLDISHFEDDDEGRTDTGVVSEGDIELEFEVEGDATDGMGGEAAADAAEPAQQLENLSMDTPPIMPEKDEGAAAEEPKKKKARKEKKKKVKKTRPVGKSSTAKPALAILLLLLIAFGAVVVLDRYAGIEIPYATEYARQVPYVNELMKPVMKKTGEITTSNINSRFVENENSGRLFVITGQVKNEFSESRRFIQLTGKLFASGKALVKEETIYCGNTLTDTQLVQMNLADVNKKLSNRFGDNQSNVDVKPGQQLPFMVVFSDFPQDLEEFTIEVVGSSPVQP